MFVFGRQAGAHACCDNKRKLVLKDDGEDAFTRSGFRWRLLDPDWASTGFSQRRSMIDRMNPGTTPHKKQ